jgi:ribonuclease-3
LADLSSLRDTLGIAFGNIALLEQALVHRSYLNENPGLAPSSNERMEYLGDAVLGLIIAEKLYRDYPALDEGEMTKLRSALVRRETLARIAEEIGLGDYIYLGKGEDSSGGRRKPANLASALEAVIAAVYIDQGLAVTEELITRLVSTELQKVLNQHRINDYKSELQEFIQSREQQIPSYHVTGTTGPDHGKTFTVEVRLGDSVLGTGSGKSKKAAETEAARSALEKLS